MMEGSRFMMRFTKFRYYSSYKYVNFRRLIVLIENMYVDRELLHVFQSISDTYYAKVE